MSLMTFKLYHYSYYKTLYTLLILHYTFIGVKDIRYFIVYDDNIIINFFYDVIPPQFYVYIKKKVVLGTRET